MQEYEDFEDYYTNNGLPLNGFGSEEEFLFRHNPEDLLQPEALYLIDEAALDYGEEEDPEFQF